MTVQLLCEGSCDPTTHHPHVHTGNTYKGKNRKLQMLLYTCMVCQAVRVWGNVWPKN